MAFIYLTGSIIYISFINSISLQNVQVTEWGYRVVLSSDTNFIVVWFLVIFSLIIINLVYNFFLGTLKRIEKKQIKIICIGSLLLVSTGLGTNLLPPLFNFKILPMTSFSTSIFIALVGYAIIRYGFLSISPKIFAKNILNTMNELVIVANEKGDIITVNRSTLNLLGYSKREMINSNLNRIINLNIRKKGDKEKIFDSKPFDKLLDISRVEDIEIEFINNKGKTIAMNVSASLMHDKFKKLEGIVIVARDLTEIKKLVNNLKEAKNKLEEKVKERTKELKNRNIELQNKINDHKKAEKKIREQNIQLKKLDDLKTVFINITSHELRTPMTSIKGYVQMLLTQRLGDLSEEQKQSLEVILRNTDRLDDLIRDILDVSRLESGTMKFIPEKIDVKTVVEETSETMKSSADRKKITINADVKEGIPYLVVDGERIKQVMMNLINNAIKFSPDGSIINVKARKEKNDVFFEVQDFGRGIPKNKVDRVFDMFYQVDSKMDRKFGGAGLGLTISRYIVMSHGGKIWVESKEGKGSTFSFTLPVKPIKDVEGRFKDVDMFLLEEKKGNKNGCIGELAGVGM